MTGQDELLGQILLESGAVAQGALEDARAERDRSGRRLGDVLLRRGMVDEVQVARALAAQLGIPFLPAPLRPEPRAIAKIEAHVARSRGVLPLALKGRRLTVAMADALDVDTLDDLRFRSGCQVDPVVAPESEVRRAVLEAYGGELPGLLDRPDGSGTPPPEGGLHLLEREASAASVIGVVDHLLATAVESRASDVHIEASQSGSRVRLRVDGVLATATELPSDTHEGVISRIKIMAGLDISVRRRPQDGAFTFRHEGAELGVRVSTIPTRSGEKAVMRLLDPADAPSDLRALGMSEHDLGRLRRLFERSQGVVLAAGPTGSGKTTTLAAAVSELAADSINVVTLEDPVEYHFPGVAQVGIDRKAGVGFPDGLRAILRQDPDVIMVGEVRDRETAEIAMSAAVTGHLVLSTIHTVDAPSAVSRLAEMGVPPFLVAGGLSGVVAQRLVRRLCARCGGRTAEGCPVCREGYRGRSGVFEVLVVEDEIRTEIANGASIATLRVLARRGGMRSMELDAQRQVADRVTTPHEAGRVMALTGGVGEKCEACGKALPAGAAGCPMCGRARANVCSCGEHLEPHWRYCTACLRPNTVGGSSTGS